MTFVDHFPNDHSQDSSAEDVPTEFNPSAEFHVNEGPRDIALVFIGDAYVAGYAVMSTSGCPVRPTTRGTQPRPLGSPYPAT